LGHAPRSGSKIKEIVPKVVAVEAQMQDNPEGGEFDTGLELWIGKVLKI